MRLSTEQEHFFIERIKKEFGRPEEEAAETVKSLQKLLYEGDMKIVYYLQYRVFKENDPAYTRKLLNFLFEGYTYLYDQTDNQEEKEKLGVGIQQLFTFLFIERCTYAKEMEEQSLVSQHILKSVSDRLNTVLKTQESMIANLSHEMRTSLNTIHGYLSIIDESKVLRGEQKFQLKKAIHGAVSLQSLVKDILNITKINSGQLEIQKSFFDMEEMLLQCIDHLSIEIKNRQSITFEYESMFAPFLVYGDQMHMMEILINFLTNAFKYTEEGFVRLKMAYKKEPKGIRAVFSVSDSGIGMTPEQLQDVFNPYSRYQKKKQGLGLGMHITKQLADRLGGELEVESEPGTGTTFSFSYLFEKTRDHQPDVKGKKIYFYIEKSMQERTYVKEKIHFLKQHGATVKTFKTENSLINFLLNAQKDIPDILSVLSEPQNYTKIDALIYYLRSGKRFEKTVFIAENMRQHLSLKYFDDLYEYCAPVKIYEKLLKKENTSKKSSGVGLSVLVVDDTETNLDIFRLFIGKDYPNAKVDLAGGGYEGVGMCKVKQYDIIFLDLKMPGMNGFEVMRKLKELNMTLPPIYAFTADVYKSTYDKIFEYGFEGILEKPLNPEHLNEILQRITNAETAE